MHTCTEISSYFLIKAELGVTLKRHFLHDYFKIILAICVIYSFLAQSGQ